MIVTIPPPVAEYINKKSNGALRKVFLGNEIFVLDGAFDEVPFTVFPFSAGLGKVYPSLSEFSLALVRGVNRLAFWYYLRLIQFGKRWAALDDAVRKLADFRSVIPSVAVSMNHPGAEAQVALPAGSPG